MSEAPRNETYWRVMDVAEELFAAHGYTAVRLRDIAERLDIKHAALYYYVPGGKEELFVHVVERALVRHRYNLEITINAALPTLNAQLHAVAGWLISQPPLNLARMHAVDFPALSPESAQRLSLGIFESLRPPLLSIFTAAAEQVDVPDPDLAVMSFLTLIEAIHTDAPNDPDQVMATADRIISMLLNGWLKR